MSQGSIATAQASRPPRRLRGKAQTLLILAKFTDHVADLTVPDTGCQPLFPFFHFEFWNMIHSQFHVDEWLDRFPLPEQPWKRHYGIVTSPVDACRIYQMREVLRDKIAWGNPVPTDVFIWGTGEPPDSRATKIGGIPHRPANSAWPDARDGEPMKFLAQICFADSLDVVGPLPENVLLLFVGEMDFDEQELHCEWQPLDIEKPLTAELWRTRGYESRFATLHGAIWRTEAFPDATLRVPWEEAREATKALETFHVTQIGTAPWWVQQQRRIRGQVIATLNSVDPAAPDIFPWINQETPLPCGGVLKDSPIHPENLFQIGDAGCFYFSVHEDGAVEYEMLSG